MTLITLNTDCANSPKREFLKEFNITFAKGDVDFIINNVTDDIVWEIIGDKKVEGIHLISEELNKMKNYKCLELIIHQVITHGKEGAVSGVIKMIDNKTYAFSDFYTFVSAAGNKIKTITSYVIEI